MSFLTLSQLHPVLPINHRPMDSELDALARTRGKCAWAMFSARRAEAKRKRTSPVERVVDQASRGPRTGPGSDPDSPWYLGGMASLTDLCLLVCKAGVREAGPKPASTVPVFQ